MNFCPECGNKITTSANFCSHCGTPFSATRYSESVEIVVEERKTCPRCKGTGKCSKAKNSPLGSGLLVIGTLGLAATTEFDETKCTLCDGKGNVPADI